VEIYNNRIGRINDDREDFSLYLEQLSARLYKEFNALDAAIQQLQTQSDFLEKQLENISNIGKKKK